MKFIFIFILILTNFLTYVGDPDNKWLPIKYII